MLPNFWYPCTLQTQGECSPNFDIHFMAWALPGTPKSSPNHKKIHPKSIKMEARRAPRAIVEAGRPLEFPTGVFWAPFWRHSADFGRRFGPQLIPRGSPKSHFFTKNQHKRQENEVQEGITKKLDLLMDF